MQLQSAVLMMKRKLYTEWSAQGKYSIFIRVRRIERVDCLFKKNAALAYFTQRAQAVGVSFTDTTHAALDIRGAQEFDMVANTGKNFMHVVIEIVRHANFFHLLFSGHENHHVANECRHPDQAA